MTDIPRSYSAIGEVPVISTNVGKQVMPRVGGKAFRCHCGCNVFTVVKVSPLDMTTTYECNACREWYEGTYTGEQP